MKTLIDQTIDRAEILRFCAGLSTIKARIEHALRNGVTLTQAQANMYPFCTSRLGACIFKLRQEGCPIITETVQVICGDGHKADVAEYRWDC